MTTAADRRSLSIILPAYNEEALIADTLDQVRTYMLGLSDRYDWEIVVVDDGSADATGDVAVSYAAQHPNVRVLRHHSNFNVGQALRYAFSTCTTDYLITLDSDLSYGPEHIGRLLETIERTRARIVIASPYLAGGMLTNVPRVRELASRNANRLLSMTAPGELRTLTGMVRAYDRRFLASMDLKSTDVAINTEIIYKAQLLGAKIVEIPAHLDWTRQLAVSGARSSSIRLTRSALAYVLSAFVFRPIIFFAIPGALALLASLWTLMWAAYRTYENYPESTEGFSGAVALAYQAAPHTFLVGGVAFIIGVQLLSLAILSMQNKRYFEEVFHLGTTVLRHVAPGLDGMDAARAGSDPWARAGGPDTERTDGDAAAQARAPVR
ncbi:MAG: glycosyltransferase family 2 protein [Actinobacteria bacterium]|nr:glycosyltransferase family 2 protein [Actinomycetota bacterium]